MFLPTRLRGRNETMTRWVALDCVAAALAGDAAATDALIATIWPRCFRLAATVIGDRNLAQDAAQEACIIVHRTVRKLRSAAAFDTWIYRIVMREAGRIRRRNERVADIGYRTLAAEEPDAFGVDIWQALGALPVAQRDVVVLFYFDDLPTAEIAAVLHVPHVTVRTRLARARQRLRGLLDERAHESTPSTEATHAF